MDSIYIYLAVGALVIFFLLGWYLTIVGRKEIAAEQQAVAAAPHPAPVVQRDPEMRRLQLQAYERLTILCERLGMGNLLSRFNLGELNAAQLQSMMIQTIRTEFEYNISQQIYVTPAAWDGIQNLKEQQIFIINQLAGMVAPDAPASALAQKMAELLSQDENATLQPIVAELLRTEARKLM